MSVPKPDSIEYAFILDAVKGPAVLGTAEINGPVAPFTEANFRHALAVLRASEVEGQPEARVGNRYVFLIERLIKARPELKMPVKFVKMPEAACYWAVSCGKVYVDCNSANLPDPVWTPPKPASEYAA